MYYFVFFMGMIFSLINDKKNILFTIFFLILLFMAFFRYGVGADYFNYKLLYNQLQNNPLNEIFNGIDSQEIGFRIIGSSIKSIGIPYEVYLMFFALVNLIFVYKICKKHSSNPTFSLVIYFAFYYFVWTLSGIRQGLVIAVGMYYLLEYISKKFSWKFIFIVIILMTIHTSAIVLILLYLFTKVPFKKGSLLILFFLSFILSLLPLNILLGKLTSLPIVSRIIPYLTDEYSILGNLDFQSIARVIFTIVVFIYYDAYSKRSENDKKILDIYLISMCLYFMLKFSELTASRIAIYGKFLDIIILVNIYYLYKQKINKFLYNSLLSLLVVAYLVKELNALASTAFIDLEVENKFIPYTSIFEKEEVKIKNNF